ncbi:MAG: hypothetical protein EBT20_11185 [Alphaproteobacteria bacterium]|nr:hypothetical protein [Alphaproteobacteria bacterium]|tara:strand:- start:3571 stop:3807 length:237 start_codon:yes stop_codon:yes gene_type:complete
MKLRKKRQIIERKTSDEWQVKAVIRTPKIANYKLQSLRSGECITISKDEFTKRFECKSQPRTADLGELLTRMALYGPF